MYGLMFLAEGQVSRDPGKRTHGLFYDIWGKGSFPPILTKCQQPFVVNQYNRYDDTIEVYRFSWRMVLEQLPWSALPQSLNPKS